MRYYGSFSNGTENLAGELPHIKQFKNKHFSAKCVGLSRAGALFTFILEFLCL